MTKRRIKMDGSQLEIAEYLLEEAKASKVVGPRYYDNWEITVASPKYRPISLDDDLKWTLLAKRRNGRTPTDREVEWARELAKLVSEDRAELVAFANGTLCFTWSQEGDNEEDP